MLSHPLWCVNVKIDVRAEDREAAEQAVKAALEAVGAAFVEWVDGPLIEDEEDR